MMVLMTLAFLFASQTLPALPAGIAPLIAEAQDIARHEGDHIWPGYAKPPYSVLLTDSELSFLFCPAGPAKGFDDLGKEPVTGCALKSRKRVFDPNLKATFPAVDGISTVVIGKPGATEGNDTAWISTLLHEHFHQFQTGQPHYYDQVAALDLTGGDTTGMWMLNYAFPYEQPAVSEAYLRMAQKLADALRARSDRAFHQKTSLYRQARKNAFASVDAAQGRYGEFQLWQEGVARYSEIAIAEASIERFRRGQSSHDYSAMAINLRTRVLRNLDHFDMARDQRVSFYALGAGEALLLDRLSPKWREHYFQTGLAMASLIYGAETR